MVLEIEFIMDLKLSDTEKLEISGLLLVKITMILEVLKI